MCNAMLMPRVTAFSAPGAAARYADAARLFGLCDATTGDEEAAAGIPHMLQALASDLEVPTLGGFGVDEQVFRKAVPTMAAAALASGSPNNNPVVPSAAQVEALYHQIWDEGAARDSRNSLVR